MDLDQVIDSLKVPAHISKDVLKHAATELLKSGARLEPIPKSDKKKRGKPKKAKSNLTTAQKRRLHRMLGKGIAAKKAYREASAPSKKTSGKEIGEPVKPTHRQIKFVPSQDTELVGEIQPGNS